MDLPTPVLPAEHGHLSRLPDRRGERGFSMLFVATMVVCLSVGAALLLSQVRNSGMVVGGRLRATKTVQAARAGAMVGCDMLEQLVFASPTAAMDLSKVRALPALQPNDPICTDGIDCTRWRLLGNALQAGVDGQTARVAVTCNPNGCTGDANAVVNFQLRALGSLDGRNRQLVEVFVEPTGT